MEIRGSKVMVLGAYGEVGIAVTRLIIREGPSKLIISSLRKDEVEEVKKEIGSSSEFPCEIVTFWGNLFLSEEMKEITLKDVSDEKDLFFMLEENFGELNEKILNRSTLFRLITEESPHIIVDCLNTASGLAYFDIYSLFEELKRVKMDQEALSIPLACKIFLASGLPLLVRHVQILYEALKRAGVNVYIKVGTTGTGGMGFNIPFTHGERTPSMLLMMKSAIAGAHSMLLYVMSKTPGSPIIKEVKPATMIAWKRIGKGKILRGGKPIKVYDAPYETPFVLKRGSRFSLKDLKMEGHETGEFLEGTYIDTGENGLFSIYEFKAVSKEGLMEFITPEEVAKRVLDCIKGASYPNDIITSLDSSVLRSTYKAGLLREVAIREMESLKIQGFSYGLLGPRVSKLIYESAILKECFRTANNLICQTPAYIAEKAKDFVLQKENHLRKEALSIGIPVLLPDGKTLLFAKREIHDKDWERESWEVQEEKIDLFAEKEWIDLRENNMKRWQDRMRRFLSTNASGTERKEIAIDPGDLTAWVLIKEYGGGRRECY